MYATVLLKASVLATTFALSAVPVWAQQQAGVKGECLGKQAITGGALAPMASVNITIPNIGADGLWHCALTCSIQTNNPGPATEGELALTIDGVLTPDTERRFEHTANADNNLDFQEVSTAKYLGFIPGDYTVACAARKFKGAGNPDFNVLRSCITVVCTDESL